MSTQQTLILALIIIIAIVVASLWANRRRQHIWKHFARQHRLTFRTNHRGPQVHGRFGNRAFHLTQSSESSDTGVLGVQEVKMRLQILGDLPAGLHVTEGGLIGRAEELLEGDPQIHTGDNEFENRVSVHADQAGEIEEYLTSQRKAAMVRLMSLGTAAQCEIEGAEITVMEREMLTSLEHLNERLKDLLEISQTLDA